MGFPRNVLTPDPGRRPLSEAELRESEERFRLMVQSVKDYAIFMLDPHGYITTWNAGAERIKGYSADEIIGQHFSIFYPEAEKAEKPARELELAIATGVYEEEGWRIRKDGSHFFASVVITPVRTESGKLTGFAKVTRDLTERRAAQLREIDAARRIAVEEAGRLGAETRAREMQALADQLRVRTEQLEEQRRAVADASRAKSEFLAAMSHELRTPLNAIGGYAQLLQMGVSGPVTAEQQVYLERIQRSQGHLLGVINDILNFSRLEAGEVEFTVATVAMCDLVESVMAMVMPQANAKELTLELGQHDTTPMAEGDPLKIEQVLLNLLSNAVKFTGEGGTIAVACGVDGDHVWLEVRDTGIGIPAHELELIFAPFKQVGRSLASPKEGTGLGLAISRDLARRMRGDLTVESEEGVGSTFRLTLPRGEG
jgi:PAS domain S-box-containing protein